MGSARLINAAQTLQTICIEHDISVAVGESLTAGLIGATLAEVPGASQYFQGGVISYSVAIKEMLLDVDPQIIAECGVVSRECAEAMARGAQLRCGARAAVAVTGEAGPFAFEKSVAVGTVWICARFDDACVSEMVTLGGSRNEIREKTTADAISLLSNTILTHL